MQKILNLHSYCREVRVGYVLQAKLQAICILIWCPRHLGNLYCTYFSVSSTHFDYLQYECSEIQIFWMKMQHLLNLHSYCREDRAGYALQAVVQAICIVLWCSTHLGNLYCTYFPLCSKHFDYFYYVCFKVLFVPCMFQGFKKQGIQ